MTRAIFIPTWGRPDVQRTLVTLRRHNVTTPVHMVVSDDDKAVERYRALGVPVEVFERAKYPTDDPHGRDNRGVTPARNACFDVASRLGADTFCVLDDDYTHFEYQTPFFGGVVKDGLQRVFDAYFTAIETAPDFVACIAMAQGGDRIDEDCVKRKAMNAWFFRTCKRVTFHTRVNEDVVAYTEGQRAGAGVFLTLCGVRLIQPQTQKVSGGLTEIYRQDGLFTKACTAIMRCPSGVGIGKLRGVDSIDGYRVHHKVSWDAVAPKILRGTK